MGLFDIFKKKAPKLPSVDADRELLAVDEMSGKQFEYWCAELLRRNHYTDVTVTKVSNDQGVDITAYFDGKKYAFQCKRYANDLGNAPIQQVYTGKSIYHCQAAVVMTNRGFTSGAKKAANSTGVILWDREKLKAMVKAGNLNMYSDEKTWPQNRMSTKINYAYYESLPNVPKRSDMKDYIRCYPLGGESLYWNPYEQERDSDMFLVELWSDDFDSDAEKEHFFKAIEKRYYALGAFVFGDLIRDKFDESKCCWFLENWA